MEPYIAENKADSDYYIMTQVDYTSGRWPGSSLDGLCKIARKCLEPKVSERATIEKVRKLTQGVGII